MEWVNQGYKLSPGESVSMATATQASNQPRRTKSLLNPLLVVALDWKIYLSKSPSERAEAQGLTISDEKHQVGEYKSQREQCNRPKRQDLNRNRREMETHWENKSEVRILGGGCS